MNDRTYAGDVLLMLGMLATFGMAGAAIAVLITVCRHSPVVIGGIVDFAEYATGNRPALLNSPRVAALLPGAAPVLERLPREIADKAPRLAIPRFAPEEPRRQTATPERPRWLEMVNDNPDLTPHALILGGSGVGKTTMATAIMNDRGGRTVVLTPKVSHNGWAGAEVVSLDDDGSYAPIAAAIDDLEAEKRRRIVKLRKEGRDTLEPLTIVLDELVDLTTREPKAGEMMVNLSSLGREINMRLVGIGTTDDALNIRGWKASRNNYVRIEMDDRRRAAISHGKRTIAVAAQDTLARAAAAHLRPWRGNDMPEVITHAEQLPLPTSQPEPDDLLASLFATMSPERKARLQQAMKVEDAKGNTYILQQQVAAPVPAPVTQRVRRREGAINMQDRARRMRRKAYYEQAARSGVPFTRAYADAPEGEKGNYNEAGQWYRAVKAKNAS